VLSKGYDDARLSFLDDSCQKVPKAVTLKPALTGIKPYLSTLPTLKTPGFGHGLIYGFLVTGLGRDFGLS
jgi:hypothetical protein